MAIQALPLLLASGAGVYVYTRAKKKKKARARKCPPENTITLGASQSVGLRAKEKYGESASPFKQASYYIEEILPEDCDRDSKNSRVKMQLGTKDHPIDFDISVPDLYMVILSGAINERFDSEKLNKKQVEKFWADGLTWYKRSTGKDFDVKSLGLEKFAEAIAVAMADAFKDFKGKIGKKDDDQESCPPNLKFEFDPQLSEAVGGLYRSEFSRGNKNAFDIADKVFEMIVPEGCTNKDYETLVEIVFIQPGDEDKRQMNLASFYASLVLDVLEELVDERMINQMSAQVAFDQLRMNYKSLTGEDLPSNLT